MTMLRVLHVDDEPDIREVVAFSLALDPELVTRGCSSGEEALTVAEDWTPYIILLDVMMPIMDGATTLELLRRNPQTAAIPVVFMTARAQSRELDMFRSLGAAGVIQKPFDPMTLAASVRAYTEPDRRLGAMRDRFLLRVDSDLVALAGHWSALEDGADRPLLLAKIRSIAHGLAGAGGIFGFNEISDAAANLEETIILEGDDSVAVKEMGSALERLLACVKRRGNPLNIPDRISE
ncbi:MAG: response regulator [Bradyrhizobium sp.]